MSNAMDDEAARQLRIKTGSLRRVFKEMQMYEQELIEETKRLEKMKADELDSADVKQQEGVVAETKMMIPDCRRRLESAHADLTSFIESTKDVDENSEDCTAAQTMLEDVRSVIER